VYEYIELRAKSVQYMFLEKLHSLLMNTSPKNTILLFLIKISRFRSIKTSDLSYIRAWNEFTRFLSHKIQLILAEVKLCNTFFAGMT
jgi:hypothetical protein